MPNQVSIWFIHDADVGVKWKLTPRMGFEPLMDVWRLVGTDVVEHNMQLALRIGPLDLAQEGEEVGAGVAGPSLCVAFAGGDF